MTKKNLLCASAVLLAAIGCRTSPDPETPEGKASEQQALVEASARTITRLRNDEDFRGMENYLREARGVLIFPQVTKAGFIVGGEAGAGILTARTASGWSDPAFYDIGGGSAGLQIGYEESSVVFFLMSDRAVETAMRGGFQLGGDLSVAAGSVGTTGAGTAGTLAADVVQVVDVGGVFAGVSLTGASLSVDDDDNRKVYGENATPRSIVLEDQFDNPLTPMLNRALTVPGQPRASR